MCHEPEPAGDDGQRRIPGRLALPHQYHSCGNSSPARTEEDIIPLAERFMVHFCKQYDKSLMKFTPEAKDKLTAHPWYGNIRELEHVIEKAVIINDSPLIPAELFQLSVPRIAIQEQSISTLEEMEVQMIRKALDACAGNLSAVAAQLGITRQTLYNKMKKFGL